MNKIDILTKVEKICKKHECDFSYLWGFGWGALAMYLTYRYGTIENLIKGRERV